MANGITMQINYKHRISSKHFESAFKNAIAAYLNMLAPRLTQPLTLKAPLLHFNALYLSFTHITTHYRHKEQGKCA